jgi:hypothetical protein
MDNKEYGLVEIYERIKANKDELGLVSFKRNPTKPVDQSLMPSVVMIEDVDNIIKRSDRSKTGYPARRVAEIVIEIVVTADTDVKALYQELRRVVFMKRDTDPAVYDPCVADNVFINENRTEGPSGFGLPDVTGMRLVLDLVYTDNGF